MFYAAAVMPHGDEVLSPQEPETLALSSVMKKIGESMEGVHEYVLVTPHNIRIWDHIGVILTEYAEGKWEFGNVEIGGKYRCDRDLAIQIYQEARNRNIPVVGINYGALEGPLSKMQLDWGTLIPLHFLPRRDIVLITPARGIPRESLVEFGRIIGEIISKGENRVALIISADHAHAHLPDGPYGYAPEAKEYDRMVTDIFRKGSLDRLLSMPPELIEKAKPDSYWQLLMLYGALMGKKYSVENYRYARPTYFGMAAALIKLKWD